MGFKMSFSIAVALIAFYTRALCAFAFPLSSWMKAKRVVMMNAGFSDTAFVRVDALKLALTTLIPDVEADGCIAAAYYASHPVEFWGDEVCASVLGKLAILMQNESERRCDDNHQRRVALDIGSNIGSMLDTIEACSGGGNLEIIAVKHRFFLLFFHDIHFKFSECLSLLL